MPASSPSTTLYTLGRGVLKIGEWKGETPPTYPSGYFDVGDCPSFEVEVTEQKLDHYSYRTGMKKKDKSVTIEIGYTVKFTLDEISVKNLQMFLRATLSGTNVLYAAQAMDKEHALHFESDNPAGPNQKWEFWKVKLTPGGTFNLISDEWAAMTLTGEGLADEDHHPTSPYFTVTFATTTTTTTTTTV